MDDLNAPFPPGHPVMLAPGLWHAEAPRGGWAVVLFRLRLSLDQPLPDAAVWVTASQRFELFHNGRRLARGPARSDQRRWNVQRVPLPTLHGGDLLAARVWHAGSQGGKAQLGGAAFLLLASEEVVLQSLLTRVGDWRCGWDRAVQPQPERAGPSRGHTAVGAGESMDMAASLQGFETEAFRDDGWDPPVVVAQSASNPWGNLPLHHALRPEPIPPMQERDVPWQRVAVEEPVPRWGGRIEGPVAAGELVGDLHVPPHTTHRVVLDVGEVVNAYPTLRWAGGDGATLRLVWCEAPMEAGTGSKGDRDVVQGKELPGLCDVLQIGNPTARRAGRGQPDRGEWTPLWFRSFRYLELTLATRATAIDLEAPTLAATGFPLRRRSQPALPDDARPWRAFLAVTDRTARLCSHETFFDCPHYEQAQFPGDARILARYHYLAYGEDRLARKAIDDLHAGRTHTGLLRSHWPSRMEQVISTYSLAWIGMLHDLLTYHGTGGSNSSSDEDGTSRFLTRYLPAARGLLDWFEHHRRRDGLIDRCEAPFIDWASGFTAGNAPQGADGGSSLVTCMVSEAARQMAGLEQACGKPAWAETWANLSESCCDSVLAACSDPDRGLIHDTPDSSGFSVHAQVQATLAGVLHGDAARDAIHLALADPDAVQPGTLYYRYWLGNALLRCGDRDGAASQLDHWLSLLDATGLTTWPESEKPNPRSDCHGWSVGGELLLRDLGDGLPRDPASAFHEDPLTPSPSPGMEP